MINKFAPRVTHKLGSEKTRAVIERTERTFYQMILNLLIAQRLNRLASILELPVTVVFDFVFLTDAPVRGPYVAHVVYSLFHLLLVEGDCEMVAMRLKPEHIDQKNLFLSALGIQSVRYRPALNVLIPTGPVQRPAHVIWGSAVG